MTNDIHVEGTEKKVEKPSLFGIIMNPREQFERIRENPKVLVSLIIVTLLTIVAMLLMVNNMNIFGNDPELAGLGEDEMMIVTLISQITFVIVGLFTPAFTALIGAVLYLIVA